MVDEVTRMLNAMESGDPGQERALLEVIYAELRSMAAGKMAGERTDHTLQATALVNEAYLRLAGGGQDWKNRSHFFGAASEAMRRILVESARRRLRDKRGAGERPEPLDESQHMVADSDQRILRVNEALDELEEQDLERARIVKLRYFVGLENREIADLLGVNERTVRRHWEQAKLWLYQAIKGQD